MANKAAAVLSAATPAMQHSPPASTYWGSVAALLSAERPTHHPKLFKDVLRVINASVCFGNLRTETLHPTTSGGHHPPLPLSLYLLLVADSRR